MCCSRRRQPVDDQRVGEVGLVDDDELGHVLGVDLGEHRAHGRQLGLGVGVRPVDDVQDQVGVGDLLQRRAERLDQLVRQVPDEPDGVGERVVAAVGGLGPADRRVEGGEQRVLDEHAGAGEPVQQARTCRRWCSRRWRPTGPRGGGAPAAWCPGPSSCRRSRGAAWPSGCGCAAGRSRSSSRQDRGCRRRRTPTRRAPPACRDIDSPQPRSRGSMYCIWASETCALPSRLLACWAKMSRISAVRSIDLDLDDVLELAAAGPA